MNKSKNIKKRGKKCVIPSFLTKLYQILENNENHNIVRWAENGKSFVVKNLPEFIDKVIPAYFKHNNFASFVRQLNMYDFHKTRNSHNENTFHHKLFIKGQKNLLKLIKRKINNNSNNSPDDTELCEVLRHEYETKIKNDNNDHKYSELADVINSLTKKQNELEAKVERVTNENKDFINQIIQGSDEVCTKRDYLQNVEMLILLLLESSRNNRISSSYEKDEDKSLFLKDLLENMNENVIRTMLEKCLDKYKVKLSDINISLKQQNQSGVSLNTTNTTPTSATTDYKYGLLRLKRESFFSIEDRHVNNFPMSTNMFEEVNYVSPCLVTSPGQSPTRYPKKHSMSNMIPGKLPVYTDDNYSLQN